MNEYESWARRIAKNTLPVAQDADEAAADAIKDEVFRLIHETASDWVISGDEADVTVSALLVCWRAGLIELEIDRTNDHIRYRLTSVGLGMRGDVIGICRSIGIARHLKLRQIPDWQMPKGKPEIDDATLDERAVAAKVAQRYELATHGDLMHVVMGGAVARKMFHEADNAKDKITGMWDNLADKAKFAWGAVGKVVSDTAGAFKKDIDKENKKAAKDKAEDNDKKMRQEAKEAAEFFRQQEEKKKKNADEAKNFIEQSDPFAKLKDELAEIDRLVGTGNLTSAQAKKAKDRELKEFSAANRRDNKVEFRSADAAANDMLEKSLEAAGIQQQQRDLLQQLVDQGNKPKMAVMG
jgi:hypothetical protein